MELLTISQVKDVLQVSRGQVYEFINDKENPLPVVYLTERNPRVKLTDLNDWIENQIMESKKQLEGGEL